MATNPNNSAQNKTLSNRTFGLIFAFIFAVIAAFPLLWGNELRMWATYIAGGFAAVSLLVPVLLTPLNRLWAKFGMMMHKITNPLLMGLVFYITVLPTGIIMRLLGKDPMRRKRDPEADTYWITREDGALKPESFDQQF